MGGEQLAQLVLSEGREPVRPRERRVDVVAVEDGLVEVLERDVAEAGALEQLARGLGIAERERLRGDVQRRRPLVVLVALPDQAHEPAAGPQRAPEVRERGGGVGEEHQARSG